MKLSAKEKGLREGKRKEISGQLKLSHLRDKLLDLSLLILIKSDVLLTNGSDMTILIASLNARRFEEVCEERLSMRKCCNLKCQKPVDMAALEKAKTLKFVLNKEDGCKKVDEKMVCFCDGNLATSKKCAVIYHQIKEQVLNVNEGGPFGTPMRTLVDLLERMKEHPEIDEHERKKINAALGEFHAEIDKVSGPIKERIPQVEKRVVKESDGNPSD